MNMEFKCVGIFPHSTNSKSSRFFAHDQHTQCKSLLCLQCMQNYWAKIKEQANQKGPLIDFTKKEQVLSLAIPLKCGCFIHSKKIKKALAKYCSVCGQKLKLRDSILSNDRYVHPQCFNQSKKQVNDIKKETQMVPEDQIEKSAQVIAKEPGDDSSPNVHEQKVSESHSTMEAAHLNIQQNLLDQIEQRDEQFFPPPVYKCIVNIPMDELPQILCSYCQFFLSNPNQIFIFKPQSMDDKISPFQIACFACAIQKQQKLQTARKHHIKIRDQYKKIGQFSRDILREKFPEIYQKILFILRSNKITKTKLQILNIGKMTSLQKRQLILSLNHRVQTSKLAFPQKYISKEEIMLNEVQQAQFNQICSQSYKFSRGFKSKAQNVQGHRLTSKNRSRLK